MKLLIPNAKELNTNQDAFSYQEFSQKPQAILDILTDFSVEDLTNFYKINSSKADQEWLRWHRLSDKEAKSYPAWLLYDGLMYRYMNRQQVSQAEQDYLDEHLRIATAFYGLVKPSEFEQVFSPDIRKRMIKIIFMENRAGKLKIHSTISKKGRGRLVSLMAEKQIETLEDIKTLTFDGFSFSPEHSDDKTVTFIRDGE